MIAARLLGALVAVALLVAAFGLGFVRGASLAPSLLAARSAELQATRAARDRATSALQQAVEQNRRQRLDLVTALHLERISDATESDCALPAPAADRLRQLH